MVEKQLDGVFAAEGGGTMQRCFALCPGIAHKTFCLHAVFCGDIRGCAAGEQYLQHPVVLHAIRCAQCAMKGTLAGSGIDEIRVGSMLQEEFA